MSLLTPEQQADWASELLESVGDSSTSNCSVTNWLKSNLGVLNSYISTDFTLSEEGDIVPEPNDIQRGVYNELFICHWLRKKARMTLGGMDFDWTEMEGEDQGKVKRVSNLQKASVYQSMAKDCDAHIKDIIKTYRGGDFARPRQITYNDRFSSPLDIHCRCFDWSELNPIYSL